MSGGWRRRPDLNRGWRFCRPLPYLLATAPRKMTRGPQRAALRPQTTTARRMPTVAGLPAVARKASEGWSGKRDSNPRLRPWQGRTLPLSYSRSRRTFKLSQTYRAKHLRGLLRRRRVDVEPAAPLEAGHTRDARHQLDVPVEIRADVLRQ